MKTEIHDYVIIGGGSAGCVLANRLSAGFQHRVLLVEAGSEAYDALFVRAPGLAWFLHRGAHDWAFSTEPQEHVDGREIFQPRGKILGGTGCINALVYIRGHAENYDAWAQGGCDGWSYDDVLPYFKRSEDYRGPESPFHGRGGPLTVTRPTMALEPVSEAFIEAGASHLGVPISDDFNGADQEGIGAFHHTLRDGERSSPATAFVAPIQSRWNLAIASRCLATELVFEGTRCTGVKIRRGNDEILVRAEREVIVSAGAFASPQLLMLSGIGPADHLRQKGVNIRLDLPGVGENLQDHLMTPVCYQALGNGAPNLNLGVVLRRTAQYALTGGGLGARPAVECGGFVKLTDGATVPDLQFHFMPYAWPEPNADEQRDLTPGRHFTILPSLLYPKSRGTVRLRSTDARDAPVIDPRYFSEEADLRLLVDGVRVSRELAETKPLSDFRGHEVAPGQGKRSDAELAADIRMRVNTIYHPVGTCKMGTDERAVVDPELRVRGIEGLRIADASIMPDIVGGNTNAPVMMIAEKAADMILRDAG